MIEDDREKIGSGLDKFASFMVYARQFPVKILAGVILLTSIRAGIQ